METTTPQDQKSTYPSLQDLESEKLAKTMESLKSGFTRLPNEILMEIVHGNLSKAEIQIVLLIARYTISFDGRETASLSKADIIRDTELQGKTVLQTMKSVFFAKNLIWFCRFSGGTKIMNEHPY